MSLLILERNCFSMPFAQQRYLNFPRINKTFIRKLWSEIMLMKWLPINLILIHETRLLSWTPKHFLISWNCHQIPSCTERTRHSAFLPSSVWSWSRLQKLMHSSGCLCLAWLCVSTSGAAHLSVRMSWNNTILVYNSLLIFKTVLCAPKPSCDFTVVVALTRATCKLLSHCNC